MAAITYSLRISDNDLFYETLSQLTDRMLLDAASLTQSFIEPFAASQQKQNGTKQRTNEEYLVEFLMMGIFSRRYWCYAQRSSSFSISIHSWLYGLRKKHQRLKPSIDQLRGQTGAWMLYRKAASTDTASLAQLSHLLRWLTATGEFNEETKRLKQWQQWLEQQPLQWAERCLFSAIEFSIHFEIQAHAALANYTAEVETFLKTHQYEYRGREDYLFCGRTEVEYHLNMFGAEILNRVLRDEFIATLQKVLLVPTCMCAPQNKCAATATGLHLQCNGCTASCGVNQLRVKMNEQNVMLRLIPHSSGFSKFLQQWQNQKHTGLIGVACVLNLLTGGYEMQRLGIPSQCIFLDNCGCKKHWHKNGVVTSLNVTQLKQVLTNRITA